MHMNERAMTGYLRNKFYKTPNCDPLRTEAKPLSMFKLAFIFVMLGVCILVSGLLFLLETIYQHLSQSKKTEQRTSLMLLQYQCVSLMKLLKQKNYDQAWILLEDMQHKSRQ